MEKWQPPAPTAPSPRKSRELALMIQEVEKFSDRLGLPIDSGIKETVALLYLMGLQTSSSCAGHTDDVKSREYRFPYIEFYLTPPEGWHGNTNNSVLEKQWQTENDQQRKIVEPLLSEFNKSRNTDPNIMLRIIDMYALVVSEFKTFLIPKFEMKMRDLIWYGFAKKRCQISPNFLNKNT